MVAKMRVALPALIALLTFLLAQGCSRKRMPRIEYPQGMESVFFDTYRHLLLDSGDTTHQTLRARMAAYPREAVYPYLLAKEEYTKGNTDRALEAIEQALAIDSTQVDFWKLQYTISSRDTKYRELNVRAAEKSVEMEPNDLDTKGTLALAYFENQAYEKCVEYCQSNYQQLQANSITDILIGASLAVQNKRAEGQEYLERYLRRQDGNSNLLYLALQASAMLENDSLLDLCYQRTRSTACPSSFVLNFYLHYKMTHRDQLKAIQVLTEAIDNCHYSTDEVESLLTYVKVPGLVDREKQEALMALGDVLVDKYPNSNSTLDYAQRCYSLGSDPNRGYRLLTRRTEQNPDIVAPWIQLLQFQLTHRMVEGHWEPMRDLSEEQINEELTEHWDAHTGSIHEIVRRFPFVLDAPITYTALVGTVTKSTIRQIDTIKYFIDYYQGLLAQSGRKDSFLVADADGTHHGLHKQKTLKRCLSSLLGYAGDLLVEANRQDDAWRYYTRSLQYNDSNSVVLNNYAYYLSLYAPNQLGLAEKLSRKSLKISKDNATYLDTYAYILYLRGEYEASEKVFVKLLSIAPNPGRTTLLHYSDLLEKIGKKDVADIYRMKAETQQD